MHPGKKNVARKQLYKVLEWGLMELPVEPPVVREGELGMNMV